MNHRMTQMIQNYCVSTETELQNAVDADATIIYICTNVLYMTSHILVNNKFIHLNCFLPNASDKCTLDAQATSRHFIISNSSIISLKQLNFVNGKPNLRNHDKNGKNEGSRGGSLVIRDKSNVEIMDCDFF